MLTFNIEAVVTNHHVFHTFMSIPIVASDRYRHTFVTFASLMTTAKHC